MHYRVCHGCSSYSGLSIMSNTSCCSRMNPLAGLSLLGAKFCLYFSLNRFGCARIYRLSRSVCIMMNAPSR